MTYNVYSKMFKYDFIINNEETLTNKPMIIFFILILMIMNVYSKNTPRFSFILNVLSRLIHKINNNKQIREFVINLLTKLVYKIQSKLNDRVNS